jgi:dTDP-glucose 4,6-dehydratase
MTKTRILITGVGGSIGCHVFRHVLRNTDWDVIGLDSFRHKGLTDRVYRVTKKHPETLHRFKIFTHDLRAPISDMLGLKMGRFDYIINLAAVSDVDDSLRHPEDVITGNTAIMVNMLEYARRDPYVIKNFMHISTDEVYGPTDGKSAHKEWDPIVPSNPYSASKACQEACAIAYWRSYNTPLTLVNLMNNFGELQSAAKFPAMVQRMVRAGETVKIHHFGPEKGYGSRYYIHSRNAADAMLFLLQKQKPFQHVPGEVDQPDRYNVVGDKHVDNLTMATLIAHFIGKPLKFEPVDCRDNRPGHDAHYGLNGEKLAQLGWKPPHSFEYSLRQTVEWYERNPEWLDPK